jgi:hypothetical protein
MTNNSRQLDAGSNGLTRRLFMKNKTLTGMALILLCAALSFSYGQDRKPLPITDQQLMTSTLAGRILDKAGNPISGVLVNCTGPGGTTGFVTGTDGAYRFNLSRTGHYTIEPQIEGSYTGQADFDVTVPGSDFIRP